MNKIGMLFEITDENTIEMDVTHSYAPGEMTLLEKLSIESAFQRAMNGLWNRAGDHANQTSEGPKPKPSEKPSEKPKKKAVKK